MARLACKSQPSAGWKPSPIGSNNKVGEEGNMATESKTSRGGCDISSCWVKGPGCHWCTYKLYAYAVHLAKNSHTACARHCSLMCWLRGEKKKRLNHGTNSSCNPAKTKEPCSWSYVLIKGLIKSFLQLNEYLISQRTAMENCAETQRRN